LWGGKKISREERFGGVRLRQRDRRYVRHFPPERGNFLERRREEQRGDFA
jgi:hypothetical protein